MRVREMPKCARVLPWILDCLLLPVVLAGTLASAQNAPARQTAPARGAESIQTAAQAAVVSDRDFAATQMELLRLLRMSPKLTTVVAHDPSLLSNQDYVSR